MNATLALAVASLAVWIACSAAWSAPGLTLAVAGGTEYAIVVADDATPPKRTAADELAAYLKRITGADFAIARPADAAGKPVIAVGDAVGRRGDIRSGSRAGAEPRARAGEVRIACRRDGWVRLSREAVKR